MQNNKQEKTMLPEINPDLLTFKERIELEKLRSQNFAAGLSLIESFANTGIKTIMMLNGGADIAMLAFLGNIIITDYSKWIYGIVWALGGYSIGAVCSAVIAFFSYLSQSSYNDEDEQSHKNADKNRFVAMIFAILGITLFVISSVIVGVTIRCY